jgi:hypothetical protein
MTSNRRRWLRDEIVTHRVRHNTFDAEQHLYKTDGVALTSVTQALTDAGLIDFSHVPPLTLQAAQERGTYVHQVLHYLLEGDYDLDDCHESFRGYVDSALYYLDELKKKPLRDEQGKAIAVEYRFWHVKKMFAGTMDYVGWDADGTMSIDDWKTGQPSDVAAPLQLAAYEEGLRECLLPTLPTPYSGRIRRRAVKLFADGAPGRPELYDDPRDLPTFYAALTVANYKRNGRRHAA